MRTIAIVLLLAAAQVHAAPVLFEGHYYELVQSLVPWNVAREDALSRTHDGMPGYLANVTSETENTFLHSLLPEPAHGGGGWLGGTDATLEGNWIWADGPEAGQVFWSGGPKPLGTALMYENWNLGEPNNGPDVIADYLLLSDAGSKWNDLAIDDDFHPEGYFVEYSPASTIPEPPLSLLLVIGIAGLGYVASSRSQKNIFTDAPGCSSSIGRLRR